MRRISPTLLAMVLAACSQGEEQPAPPAAQTSATPAPVPPAPVDSDDGEAEGRKWRYTSVSDCTIERESDEEMPFVETLCEGPAGYKLRISDSDARQSVAVIAPDGGVVPLNLSRIGGGGFSSLGEKAEWRGPAGEPFVPDALIVRYNLAESPYPEPPTSYLLAIRLAPDPCVTSRIAPGPAQNEIARQRADDPGACLAD